MYKDLVSNVNTLLTCDELIKINNMEDEVERQLTSLGYKANSRQRGILFCALNDILVVVDKDDNFYLVTMSTDKLLELKNLGRLLPKNGELDWKRTSSLVTGNTIPCINEYLGNNKFHFIKLNRFDCNSFFCSISGMRPYPDLKGMRVYPLDLITKYFYFVLSKSSRGMVKINDIVCTTSPLYLSSKNINNVSVDCKLNVKTIDGLFEEIYLWNIKSIESYYESDKIKALMTGVCRINNTLVTLNRDILERYYGSYYLDFESKGVRERYCLEEIYDSSSNGTLSYYISKYRFYKDREINMCKDVFQLREVLRSRLKPVEHDDKYINVRVLTSSGQLYSKKKSYYRKISVSDELEVVQNLDEILPRTFKVAGVCPLGYTSVEVKATSVSNAIALGTKEFKRQFGSLYNDKILGVQELNKFCEGKHPVYSISLDTQRKLTEVMSWGYVNHYDDYSKYIRAIFKDIDVDYTVSDDAIKFLFVNKIAKEVGKGGKVTLQVVGTNLEHFIHQVKSSTQDEFNKKVTSEHKRLSKKSK